MFQTQDTARLIALICTALALAGCMGTMPVHHQMPTTNSMTYAPAETLRSTQVLEGIVVAARQVSIKQGPDWSYQTAGAAAGVALANRLTRTRSASTRAATAAFLGLVGAKTLDAAGREAEAQSATELIVRLDQGTGQGSTIVVVQPGPSPQPGTAVYVLNANGGMSAWGAGSGSAGTTRVVPR